MWRPPAASSASVSSAVACSRRGATSVQSMTSDRRRRRRADSCARLPRSSPAICVRSFSPCASTSSGSETSRTAGRAAEVVEDGRGAVSVSSSAVSTTGAVLQRDDRDLIDRRRGSLRRRVVGAERFDGVADELEANGLRVRRRGRCRRRRRGPQNSPGSSTGSCACSPASTRRSPRSTGEISLPGLQRRATAALDARGRRETRQERRGRRHDDARRSGAQRVERARARRRDVEVRRQTAIGIDLMGREREHGALGLRVRQPFERGEEEPGVRGELFDLGVGRHDEQHRRRARRRGRGEQRLGRRRQAGDARRRHTMPQPAGGRLQQRAKRQRGGGRGGSW